MIETTTGRLRRGASTERDPRAAIHEVHDAIGGDSVDLCVLFVAPTYDRTAVASAIRECFGDTTVVGCTTAGEIDHRGYTDGSITGFSFDSRDFRCATARIDDLASFSMADGFKTAEALAERLEKTSPDDNTFGFLLVDGLCCQEEHLISSLYRGLGRGTIPIVGGSAGDGLEFESTWVYHDGAFHSNAAVITIVSTSRPIRTYKTSHFERSDRRIVVTSADPSTRTVHEINGAPAAAEYARLLGYDPSALTTQTFSSNPVVIRAGDSDYVRAIQKLNDDGSFTFFCAIDEGVVLRLANPVDMLPSLDRAMASVRSEIGTPELTIGFDCILRRLELEHRGLLERAGALMAAHNVVGFSTYGEQYEAMHASQTFTAVAIGGAS